MLKFFAGEFGFIVVHIHIRRLKTYGNFDVLQNRKLLNFLYSAFFNQALHGVDSMM